jgi:rubrerythrin
MNVKDAIKTAIQMEKDGYSFYKKAAAQTSNTMGSKIFESIAADELVHLEVFQKLFKDTIGKNEWNTLVDSSKKYQHPPIFPKDLKQVEGVNPDTNELDALHMAMDSEQDAIDYYMDIRKNTDDTNVTDIIDEIIAQEKNHYNILNQEFNHLSRTGYWYELDYLGE